MGTCRAPGDSRVRPGLSPGSQVTPRKRPASTRKSGLGAGPGHPEPRRERTRNSASQKRSCRLILKQR